MTELWKKIMAKFIGPGGLKCRCCAPPRGKRREIFKISRSLEKKMLIEEGMKELDEGGGVGEGGV